MNLWKFLFQAPLAPLSALPALNQTVPDPAPAPLAGISRNLRRKAMEKLRTLTGIMFRVARATRMGVVAVTGGSFSAMFRPGSSMAMPMEMGMEMDIMMLIGSWILAGGMAVIFLVGCHLALLSILMWTLKLSPAWLATSHYFIFPISPSKIFSLPLFPFSSSFCLL